jgi:hypothetical protein
MRRFRCFLAAAVLGAAFALNACAAPPNPYTGPDPANPGVRMSRVGYQSALGSYRSQRPVDPGDWRSINERVAPQPKPER